MADAAAGRALFRALMRTSSQFASFNFKHYSRDRVRAEFKLHQHVQDAAKVAELRKTGQDNLAMLRRQTLINSMYAPEPLVLERQALRA